MRSIQIVTHCHGFSKALAYQLSSLHLHPPQRVSVTATVLFSLDDDATHAMLRYFDIFFAGSVERWTGEVAGDTPNVTLDVQVLDYEQMMNRSIGRNIAALSSTADLLWMCDADYHFGKGCLDALADIPIDGPKLFYPKTALFNYDKANGDAYTARVTGPGVYDIAPKDFIPHGHKRAIGGIQIVPGHVARTFGYCNEPAHQKPSDHWVDTRGDRTFRGILGTPGVPIELPNLYRIRQSVEFQCDATAASARAED